MRDALLAAAIKMRDILLQECRDKASLDPLEDDCNADYHINPTITVGEIKAFCEAVNVTGEAALPAKENS